MLFRSITCRQDELPSSPRGNIMVVHVALKQNGVFWPSLMSARAAGGQLIRFVFPLFFVPSCLFSSAQGEAMDYFCDIYYMYIYFPKKTHPNHMFILGGDV